MAVSEVRRLVGSLSGYYRWADRLIADVEVLLPQMRSLRANIGLLRPLSEVPDPGIPARVLYLFGTLPIFYQNGQYNIPIQIYFESDYPHQAPRCFVTPTANMVIRPRHKFVDTNGVVYLPYLSSWRADTGSLPELLQFMASTFSNAPPVYAKPNETAAATKNRSLPKDMVIQRIKENWNQEVKRIGGSLDEQIMLQEELKRHCADSEAAMLQLKRAIDEVRSDKEAFNEAGLRATEFIVAESARPFTASNVVEAVDALSEQTMEMVALELACEDVIASHEDAFNYSRIDLECYLSGVREYSRRQFHAKFLRKKATERLQLQGSGC